VRTGARARVCVQRGWFAMRAVLVWHSALQSNAEGQRTVLAWRGGKSDRGFGTTVRRLRGTQQHKVLEARWLRLPVWRYQRYQPKRSFVLVYGIATSAVKPTTQVIAGYALLDEFHPVQVPLLLSAPLPSSLDSPMRRGYQLNSTKAGWVGTLAEAGENDCCIEVAITQSFTSSHSRAGSKSSFPKSCQSTRKVEPHPPTAAMRPPALHLTGHQCQATLR